MLTLKIQNSSGLQELSFNPYTMKFDGDMREAVTIPQAKIHGIAPKVLKIYLGDACNFRCLYCRQDMHSKKGIFNKAKLNNFLALLKDNLDLSAVHRIEYWGGEPLLYWQEVEYLMYAFEQLLPQVFWHHITTNGSLLSNAIADSLKARNAIVKISHDGAGQHLRSGDPLVTCRKIVLDLYKHLRPRNAFYINSVMTRLCPSPLKIVDFFRNALGQDVEIMKIEPVIPYNDAALSYALGLQDMPDFSAQLLNDLRQGDLMQNVVEYRALFGAFLKMNASPDYVYNMTEAKCHEAQTSTLCLDLDGNITPCQVYDARSSYALLGNVRQMDALQEYLPFAPIARTGRCTNCPVISLCRGVCPYIPQGKYAEVNCSVRFHTYLAVLLFCIESSLHCSVREINGDFFFNRNKHE